MSEVQLTKTFMRQGVWEGVISGTAEKPSVKVTHLDRPVDGIELVEDKSDWRLRIPIPMDAISDGVQTILIRDQADDAVLGSVTLIAGEALGDDMRVEIDLLRAELDMLKRAFRRHCTETM